MTALQKKALLPSKSTRRIRRRSPRIRLWNANQVRSLAVEISLKLGVNILLSGMAISALIKLIPLGIDQQSHLKELEAEVAAAQGRVDQNQAKFTNLFDPRQAKIVMQDESVRLSQTQYLVIWRSAR